MSTKEIISIIEEAIEKEAVAVEEFIQQTGMTKSYYSNFKNGHRDFNLDSLTKYLIALKRAIKNKKNEVEAVEKITDIFFESVIDDSLLHLYKAKFKQLLDKKLEEDKHSEHSSIISMLKAEGVSSKDLLKLKDLGSRILDDLKGYL
jgi:phosphopentomutase